MKFDRNGHGEQPIDLTTVSQLSLFLKARAEANPFAVRLGGLEITGAAVMREEPGGKLILDLGALPSPEPVSVGPSPMTETING